MVSKSESDDARYMAIALGLARRGLGQVWPNPSVGCVLFRAGRVLARGWTQPGGRPHAEAEALGRAREGARDATAYVSLEPCAHRGQTPSCARALVEAGIARAVVALEDPDPRTQGRGMAFLRGAGVKVDLGVGGAEAAEINAGFIMRLKQGRPLVTFKLASSLDGRIATHSGASRWISGERARDRAHLLRAEHDAVMVGVGTALADDPRLTCRLPGLEHRSPIRLVVDSRLRLPLVSRLVSGARETPTWIVTLAHPPHERAKAYRDCGVELIEVAADEGGYPDLGKALRELGERGLTRVLVEGGSVLAAALLRRALIDRLVWFRAPRIIGGDGLPAAASLGVDRLDDAPRFRRVSVSEVGADLMETYTAAS